MDNTLEKQSNPQINGLAASPSYLRARKRVPVFERTVQKTKGWISEMQTELEWMSASDLYHLLRAVLQTLRDQLSIHEAAQFAAQLPLLLKGTFYECWNPSETAPKPLNKENFLIVVHEKLDLAREPDFELEHGIRVAVQVIMKHVSAGEMKDVLGSLNHSVKEILQTN